MTLQLAEIEDLDTINKIYRDAVENMRSNNIFQWDESYPNKNILNNDIAKNQLYKMTLNNEIISIFVLNKEYDNDYSNGNWEYTGNNFMVLHRLCVNTKYQNKGFGAKIVLYIEDYLKTRGVDSIRLDTFSKNPIALMLYNKLGYRKTGEVNWKKGIYYLFEKVL